MIATRSLVNPIVKPTFICVERKFTSPPIQRTPLINEANQAIR